MLYTEYANIPDICHRRHLDNLGKPKHAFIAFPLVSNQCNVTLGNRTWVPSVGSQPLQPQVYQVYQVLQYIYSIHWQCNTVYIQFTQYIYSIVNTVYTVQEAESRIHCNDSQCIHSIILYIICIYVHCTLYINYILYRRVLRVEFIAVIRRPFSVKLVVVHFQPIITLKIICHNLLSWCKNVM